MSTRNSTLTIFLLFAAFTICNGQNQKYDSLISKAKASFDSLWGYRTGAPEKAAAYLQSYVADPTIADTAVPAKAETSMAPPSGPPTAGGNVKVAAGAGGQVPGAANGKAAAATKTTKAAPKGKKKRR